MKTVELKNDIDRLEKQRAEIEAQIAGMIKQTEEYYQKRRKAAQELDAVKLENESFIKNLQSEKTALVSQKSELEKKKLEFGIILERHAESKEAFSKERAIYRDKQEELSLLERQIKDKLESLTVAELALDKEADELAVVLAHNCAEGKKLKESQGKLEELLNSNKAKESELNQQLSEISSKRDELLDEFSLKEKALKIREEDFEKHAVSKDKDFDLRDASLKKRELDIARKEKELNKLSQDLKARKEQIEIEEGRTVKHE